MATPNGKENMMSPSLFTPAPMRAFGSPLPVSLHKTPTTGMVARSPFADMSNSPAPSTLATPSKRSVLSPTSAHLLAKCARVASARLSLITFTGGLCMQVDPLRCHVLALRPGPATSDICFSCQGEGRQRLPQGGQQPAAPEGT